MNQFIGDLITSGNTSKEQALPDVLNAAWGVAGVVGGGVVGVGEALGFKTASVEPPQQPRPAQDKPGAETRRQIRSGSSQRKGEPRDRREGQSSS